MDLELVGWIGSTSFAIAALPQVILCLRQGHAKGVSWGLLVLWGLGEILTLIYTLPKGLVPLIFNYTANIVFISVIVYFKIWPRENE